MRQPGPPLAAVGATLVFLEDETQREKRADKKAQKLAEKLAQKKVAPATSPAAASPPTAEKGNVAT